MSKKRSSDPSIHKEPHIRGNKFQGDSRAARADRVLDKTRKRDYSEDLMIERTVWDEPALSGELVGERPAGELTYSAWLQKRWGEVGPAKSVVITLGIAIAAGPVAILGAFYGSGRTISSVFAIVVFGPIVEEIMKVALALFVVEKKPFYFRSSAQIFLCVLVGGLVFSAIENVVYHNVYMRDPPPGLVRWRWTVCVAMHMGCSFIAGLGLVRIWRRTWKTLGRTRISLAYPYVLAATVLHGTYNAFAMALQYTGFHF